MQVKLVLLGESGVGKSCIALRAVQNTFTDEGLSTLGGAFMTLSVNTSAGSFRYDIWDTAGQERFSTMAPMYYRSAQFALVIYDVTSESSFTRAKKWVAEVKHKCMSANIVIVLVGNKCDKPKSEWNVKTDDAKDYAASEKLLFFESSAKANINVAEIFTQLANDYVKNSGGAVSTEDQKKILTPIDKPSKEAGCCK